MKTWTVAAPEELDLFVEVVTASANKAMAQLSQLGPAGLHALWSMKFQPIGCNPLDSESPLNLIEQLNQTFTYLASARAARMLIVRHPMFVPLTPNLGTAAGSDIESSSGGGLAAEVFAAVNTSNNRKLANDVAKVARTSAEFKYVFFMCPGYTEGRQRQLERQPGVEIWSVGGSL